MITKIILSIILISVVLSFIIDVVLPKEKVVYEEQTSEVKNPYYIKYGWMKNSHYPNYKYYGETTSGDRKLYVYRKYLIKYKWDGVNWIMIKKILNVFSLALSFIFILCILIATISSFNNSKRADVLEHQINYVEELNEEVDVIVKSFMQHEEITFDRNISLEALVITYPELRSVELVSNQLETLKQEKQKLNEIEVSLIRYKTIEKWFKMDLWR